jgi:hypothetical protein
MFRDVQNLFDTVIVILSISFKIEIFQNSIPGDSQSQFLFDFDFFYQQKQTQM